MSVQFVLGRAGAGKTRHLLNQMIALVKTDPLGPPIYWLVPRQATFQAERLLTATLKAFSRIRVVSFDQLGKEILIHCGDVGIPEVTAVGRRMVIGHLLRVHQNQLKYYSRSAHRRGLATELDSTFGEFERAGLDAADLDQVLQQLDSDDRAAPELRDKLLDLHLLLQAYNQFIGQERVDPQRRMSRILKRVAECDLLQKSHVFVDDFYDFSAHERRLLTAVAGAAVHTSIALLIDPAGTAVKNPTALSADLSTFHRTERTYRSLIAGFAEAGITVDPPIVLNENHRAAHLRAIERGLFAESDSIGPSDAIEAFDAPDARGEVDAVARRIRSAILGGARYRDIGVLVRDLGEYQQIIDASFAEHGLPYFADRRRTAAHHPLLQMVRAALQIARRNWPEDAVMILIKTGLAGLTDDQADELENYVLKHRIRRQMWQSPHPWMFTRDLIIAEDESAPPQLSESARIDQFRRSLVEKLSPLLEIKGTSTVRELTSKLFAMLDAFDVRTKLQEWMNRAQANNDLERRDEHEQVWSSFIELCDHMVDLLGDEPITLADFTDVLDAGLESFDLAITPVKADQILVGQIDRTRAPELKMVFVLGLNEGTFPKLQNDRSVITDRERRALRQRNIDLDPDSERRLLDERFLAYLAFTRASQRLIISRPTADSAARPTHPSIFWNELARLVPDLTIQHVARTSRSDPASLGTPRQMVTGLMRWVRTGAAQDAGEMWPSLYQWLVIAKLDDGLKTMRDRAWPALRYTNTAALDSNRARELFPSPLLANARQLETFAECPFRHFSAYGLRLRNRDEPDVTRLDLSNAYHDILENIVKDVLERKTNWCSLSPSQINEMIRVHAAEIGRRLRGELMLSSARNRYLLDRIEQNLEQAIATMTEIHRRGAFHPAMAAVRFGKGQTLGEYVVKTPAGGEVHLQGQIDRIDMNNKRSGFVINDYKMTGSALSMDRVYHGLSLQLLASLLVVQANGPALAGQKITPAAAFVLQLLRSPQLVDHPSQAMTPADPDFALRPMPRGIIDARAVPYLDKDLKTGPSKVINVFLRQDGERGKMNATDAAGKEEFNAILQHVEKKLGELGDQITTGNIAVMPYMIARKTPCSHCEFRSVCRFEPGINRYRMLQAMKREEVMIAVTSNSK